MSEHGVVILNMVAAKNVDSWNRSAVASSALDIDNGYVFRLDSKSGSAAYSEVWDVTACSASGSTLNGLWMAYSPEITTISNNGKYYRGLEFGQDPRDFYNMGGYVFDAFKPQVGDLITLDANAVSGSPSTGDYVNAVSGSYILVFGATQTSDALSLKLVKETYISLATGQIDDQRELAYQFQVLAN